MDKDTVTLRIRERLDARMLPRVIPSLMREPGRPTSPRGNIYKDSSIGVAECAACDDPGAQIAYPVPGRPNPQVPRPMPPNLGVRVSTGSQEARRGGNGE